MKHAELIARLEAAERGTDDLDCAVYDASGDDGGVCDFTTSLDAALALAERALQGWSVLIFRGSDSSCALMNDDPALDAVVYYAKTPALALCIAILRALDANS